MQSYLRAAFTAMDIDKFIEKTRPSLRCMLQILFRLLKHTHTHTHTHTHIHIHITHTRAIKPSEWGACGCLLFSRWRGGTYTNARTHTHTHTHIHTHTCAQTHTDCLGGALLSTAIVSATAIMCRPVVKSLQGRPEESEQAVPTPGEPSSNSSSSSSSSGSSLSDRSSTSSSSSGSSGMSDGNGNGSGRRGGSSSSS